MTTTRIRVIAAVAAGLALALTGCSGGGHGETADPGAEPGIASPAPLIDLACDRLLDADALARAMGGTSIPAAPPPRDGLGGLYELAQDGALQAGALQCSWADGSGADDHYLDVTVLPDATSSWARFEDDVRAFQPRQGQWGEASWVDCVTSSALGCRADALVGDRWVNVRGYGMSDEAGFGALMDTAVEAVRAAAPRESRWTHDSPAAASCDSMVASSALGTAAGGEMAVWLDRPTAIQPVIFQAGFEQAGGVICSWRGVSDAVARTIEVGVLPGGGWAFDGRFAVAPREGAIRTEAAGLGDRAVVTLLEQFERSYGYASVLVGSTWLDVSVNIEGSDADAEIAEAIARLLVAG